MEGTEEENLISDPKVMPDTSPLVILAIDQVDGCISSCSPLAWSLNVRLKPVSLCQDVIHVFGAMVTLQFALFVLLETRIFCEEVLRLLVLKKSEKSIICDANDIIGFAIFAHAVSTNSIFNVPFITKGVIERILVETLPLVDCRVQSL